jgi:hypothetical protein
VTPWNVVRSLQLETSANGAVSVEPWCHFPARTSDGAKITKEYLNAAWEVLCTHAQHVDSSLESPYRALEQGVHQAPRASGAPHTYIYYSEISPGGSGKRVKRSTQEGWVAVDEQGGGNHHFEPSFGTGPNGRPMGLRITTVKHDKKNSSGTAEILRGKQFQRVELNEEKDPNSRDLKTKDMARLDRFALIHLSIREEYSASLPQATEITDQAQQSALPDQAQPTAIVVASAAPDDVRESMKDLLKGLFARSDVPEDGRWEAILSKLRDPNLPVFSNWYEALLDELVEEVKAERAFADSLVDSTSPLFWEQPLLTATMPNDVDEDGVM